MTRMIRTAGPGAATTIPYTPHDRWRADRLREARGILAEPTLHPETLRILAARVVIAHSDDDAEIGGARDLWRSLDPRRAAAMAQATCPKGGAA